MRTKKATIIDPIVSVVMCVKSLKRLWRLSDGSAPWGDEAIEITKRKVVKKKDQAVVTLSLEDGRKVTVTVSISK